MAVQAHYSSNVFIPDLKKRSRSVIMEELQFQNLREQQYNVLRGGLTQAVGHIFNGNTVYSDPESELTCNISAPKKRNRGETNQTTQHQHQHQQQQQQQQQQINLAPQQQQEQMMHRQLQQIGLLNLPKVQEIRNSNMETGLQLSRDEIRINQSGGTSTSGKRAPIVTDLTGFLCQQNNELDAFIRLQNERLYLGFEERRKRHYRSLLSLLEQPTAKKLTEKYTELESVRTRNIELEEKLKQLVMENQMWQNVARNNESVVSNLKSSLEQVLQNMVQSKEGFGDSEDVPTLAGADDAQSYCCEGFDDVQTRTIKENEELRHRKLCTVCHENEISVLLLPCRHLCLCKDCESKQEFCSICNSNKNASLQVYMS